MNLDEIEARANAATPGPWHGAIPACGHEHDDEVCSIEAPDSAVLASCVKREEDLQFILAARTDVPALVARVRELEAESAKWKEAFERIRRTNTDLMMQLFDAQEATRAVNISPVLHENAMLKSMVLGLEAELLKRKL
jgi:hypothetical protein